MARHARRDGDHPRAACRRIDNLFLAGDYMGVPSVNGALSSGHSAAIEVTDLFASRAS